MSLSREVNWLVFFLCAVALQVLVIAGETDPSSTRDAWKGIQSESKLARRRAFVSIGEQHREWIGYMAGLVGSSPMPKMTDEDDPTVLACRLLGEAGSRQNGVQQAIPLLVENVELHAPTSSLEVSGLPGYPCAEALRSIGHTAVPYILTYLQERKAEEVSDKAIELFGKAILGMGSLAPASRIDPMIVVLRTLVASTELDQPSENLSRLLRYLEDSKK